MIVSHQKRFVMLLPWKTASQTVLLRLQAYNDHPYKHHFYFSPLLYRVTHQHITCAEFSNLPESKLEYLTASFVRNPYDRVYSGFRQLQKDIVTQPNRDFPEPWIGDLVRKQLAENFLLLSKADFKFDRWLASISEEHILEIGRNTNFPLHPAHYWTHYNGKQLVDFIGRVEKFEADFKTFLTRVNISDVSLSNANVGSDPGESNANHGYRYAGRMKPESIEKINRLFAADFEFFNYTLLNPADYEKEVRRTTVKPAFNVDDFTGERLVKSIPPGRRISTEHLHRYAVAAQLCKGLRVLDIACGDGYGSALLSQHAASVTGVDILSETVNAASVKYLGQNLTFLQGCATEIPLPDSSVDMVVSFETIEHLEEHECFLSEIRRVLVPGGLLLISTPDKAEFSDRHGQNNPFHLLELTRIEFKTLLETNFQNVSLSGQRYVTGSWLENSAAPTGSMHGVFTADYEDMPFTSGASEPIFWLACCSDNSLPALKLGMCLPPRPTLDAWLEAIEILPSPEPLLEVLRTYGAREPELTTASQLIQTLIAYEKQQVRAEKWKARAESLKAQNALMYSNKQRWNWLRKVKFWLKHKVAPRW